MKIIKKDFLINEEIRHREIRVVSDDDGQLGIMSSSEALKIAEEKELDLVLISPSAKPPVCKIMNYGKFIYEKNKMEKEARKKQKVTNVKEIRLSATIEKHDIEIKANRARKFLSSEDKVKVTVRFRGRQVDYSHKGNEILNLFFSMLEDVGVIEKSARLEGKNMTMVVAPKRA